MRKMLTSLVCLMCTVCFSVPVKSNLGARSVNYAESAGIPYDAEVEYIASGNTGAYIDIGYKPKEDTIFEIDGFGSVNYGCFYAGNHRYHSYDNGQSYKDRFCCGSVYVGDINSRSARSTRAYWIFDTLGTFTTDDYTFYFTPKFLYPLDYFPTFCLFARNNVNGTKNTGAYTLYSFKWYENRRLVLDLIPVRIGEEGFLYDRCRGRLFGNVGSGAFIVGPDIEP